MKTKYIKQLIILMVLITVITPLVSLAQESLEQASETDVEELGNLLESVAESAFQTSPASSGNDFNVDLVWKTNTLLPYDYPGKALPSTLSSIIFHAIADVPNPNELVYTWLIDDISSNREGPELQGRGESIFNWFTLQIPSFTHEIRVFAQDRHGKKGNKTLKIKIMRPETYFYLENNNNYNNAVFNTLTFPLNTETSLLVRPFYFNTSSLANLEFNWRFAGKKQENASTRKDILPLSIPDKVLKGAYGRLQLELINTKQKNNYYDRAGVNTEIKIVK